MSNQYSIRIDAGDGSFSYFADRLGRSSFPHKMALQWLKHAAASGNACSLVRN
jgi:hypothetical protein